MTMNAAHIHLLLNHFPTIGLGIGLVLFAIAILRRSEELQRTGLVILFLTSALTIVAYVSGNDAHEALKEEPGLSDTLMRAHESAALVAFTLMQAMGFFSWIGLWIRDRHPRFAGWNLGVVLILGISTFGLMAQAANLGGEIRHPEIQNVQTPPIDNSAQTLAASWGLFVQDHSWVWPACETLHFVGLCQLFGVVLIGNLRMLGVGKALLSFADLYQLLPLGMLGFTLNLITGMMFFVATPGQYTGLFFLLKMSLVGAGALNVLYFILAKAPWSVGYGDDATMATKLIAASAIAIWLAVVFCGQMLPWLGNSF
jgi:hypothetical protein